MGAVNIESWHASRKRHNRECHTLINHKAFVNFFRVPQTMPERIFDSTTGMRPFSGRCDLDFKTIRRRRRYRDAKVITNLVLSVR